MTDDQTRSTLTAIRAVRCTTLGQLTPEDYEILITRPVSVALYAHDSVAAECDARGYVARSGPGGRPLAQRVAERIHTVHDCHDPMRSREVY